ncbi:MAG: PriCT-2 domain-containing protein [Myxacorys californica WJT36-NPBG1]|jgi:regulator of replication initiation timing|nr:PriCT-2 domain-containing protein [Myxacorys californica WJT36-NPBG1]
MQLSNSSPIGYEQLYSADQYRTLPQIFKFATNVHGCNKDWNFRVLSGKFQDIEGTIEDAIAHIKQGHAICAGLLNSQWRSKSNFAGSNWVLAEIDNAGLLKDDQGNLIKDAAGKGIKTYEHQLTLDEAIVHPFIQQFCTLIYTTPSHSQNWHRFRVIFRLPEFISDIDTYESIVQFLLDHLPHDPACKDGVRVFYGNTEAEFPLINPDVCLPKEWVNQAIAKAQQIKQERAKQAEVLSLKREQFYRLAQAQGWDTEKLIQQALSHIPPRTPGSSNYQESCKVLMALVDHYGAVEAEVIAERWSPSIERNTWNIRQKIRSFRRKGITIGTLFHVARNYGFKFPYREWNDPQEPDRNVYDAIVAAQEERARLEHIEVEHHQYSRLKSWLKGIQQRFEVRGFGKPHKVEAKVQVETLKYLPGKLFRLGSYEKPPKLLYTKEQLPQLLWEATAKGWRDILDSTQTGGGKSYNYALLSPLQLGVHQVEDEQRKQLHRVWLLSQSHRNPSTEPAERSYTDLPVRNAGFVKDATRRTPLGRDLLRWAKPGEQPDTEGNCHLTAVIHKAANKSVSIANDTAELNPFCAMCHHKDYCKESLGNGFGFRFERAEVFSSSVQVRASIDSLPSSENYAAYSGDVAILDEALIQLKPVRTISANLGDFDTQWAEMEANLPEVYRQLNPLRQALRPLVAGESKQHYGFDNEALRSQLPEVPEKFVQTLESIRQIMGLKASDLTQDPDQIQTKEETEAIAHLKGKIHRRSQKLDTLQAEWSNLQALEEELNKGQGSLFSGYRWSAKERQARLDRLAKLPEDIAMLQSELDNLQTKLEKLLQERSLYKSFNRSQFRDAKVRVGSVLDNLPTQWLIPFLEVWSEEMAGALRIGAFGGLVVTIQDDRHNEILNSLKTRIYLDATAIPEVLSLYRQISISKILWIAQDLPSPDNLTLIWIEGLGLAGKNRSQHCDDRINAILTELKGQFSDLVVFDWQRKKNDTNADGHWFSDFTRGTNEFSDRKAIIAIGLPLPNAGVFHDLWFTLTKYSELESLSFEEFYHYQIDTEIIQAIGRLRAIRRPSEKLTFFLIGDTEHSRSANYQLPISLRPIITQAREITPHAATPTELAWIAVSEILKQWWSKNGTLPTQQEIAAESGISQSSVSKLAQQFVGGWRRLKEIFLSLIDPPREWNIFTPLSDELAAIAQTALPILSKPSSELSVAEALSLLIKSIGWAGWQQMMSQTAYSTRLAIAAALSREILGVTANSKQFETG